MKIKGKVLIIFETSTIRNPNNCYNTVNFGADFFSIKKYISDHNLSDDVLLAITKFSVDEFLIGRNDEFLKDISLLKKIEGIPNVSLINKDFDYKIYLGGKIKSFFKQNNIFIIPYPNKDRFYSITKRSLLKNKPFIQTKSHSDYGFKDVVIWESILSFRHIKNFKKVVLVCGDGGFNESCEKEFINVHDVFFKVFKDYKDVIKEIEETILVSNSMENNFLKINDTIGADADIDKLDLFLKSNYFLENVSQIISSDFNIDIKKIDNLKISESTEPWIVEDEEVGRIVAGMVQIDKIENPIFIYLDDTNSIEFIDYNNINEVSE